MQRKILHLPYHLQLCKTSNKITNKKLKAQHMRLSHTAVSALKGDEEVKKLLSALMGVELSTVYRWVNENKKNGTLTTYKAVGFISEHYGLTTEQILDDDIEMELQESDVHVEPIENYKKGL